VWPQGSADDMPRPTVTLTFDRLTLKLVCKSHLRWVTFVQNLNTLGLWVINYSLCMRRTDRQTDGRTKATLIAPSLRSGA